MCRLNKDVLDNLGSDQILCAFKGMHLTSKYGMMRLLKKATKTKIIDSSLFFPQAFDLQEKVESTNFILCYIGHECLKELWTIAELIEDKIDVDIMQTIYKDNVSFKLRLQNKY